MIATVAPASPSSRLVARAASVLVAALVLVLLAGPAFAHPALVGTTPGAGYAVTDPPPFVAVTFNEPVTPVGADALTLTYATGAPVDVDVDLAEGGQQLRGVPTEPLRPASYVVRYRVVALDGDLIEGAFPFGVATPVEAGSSAGGVSQDDPDQVQPVTAVARAGLFAGLALALGGVVGAAVVRRAAPAAAARVGPSLRLGSALGAVSAMVLLAQVTGLDPDRAEQTLATSSAAQLLAAEAALFAAAALLASVRRLRPVAAVALGAVVMLEALRAHPGEAAPGAGVALTLVHLAAATVWLGGLVHTARVVIAVRRGGGRVSTVVGEYAQLAFGLFVLVLGTGTLSALLLLPTLADWTGTTYGRLLLVKLALFVVAVAAAFAARLSLRRAAKADDGNVTDGPGRRWRMRRPVTVEVGALAAILVVTAALTSVTPPTLVSQTSLLPAPTGAVLRTAERIDQITVALVASQGRLEARAYAPGNPPAEDYDLDLLLRPQDGTAAKLDLHSCGEACWTAPVDWEPGLNTVVADVSAAGWTGGEAPIAVPWPPDPAPELLATVQQVMGAQTEIRATESVTSGFGAAPTTTSVRTGQEFLADEPWSKGGVADPVSDEQHGQQVLLFAVPELGYHFRFTLDERNRVSTARVVTRKHLLERSYTYPD